MQNLLLFISLICSYFLLYGPNGGGEDESLLMQLNILVQEGKTQDVEQFVKMMHFGDFSRLFIDTAVQQNEPWLRTGFTRSSIVEFSNTSRSTCERFIKNQKIMPF